MISEFKILEEIKNVATQIIYLSKSLESSAEQLKSLNINIKNASKASDRNSKIMVYLTYALVFLGFAQMIVAGLNMWTEKSITKLKKQCYQNVLQTSDIDLNYKNCLRNEGLSN